MAITAKVLKQWGAWYGGEYRILRRWRREGHEVALLKLTCTDPDNTLYRTSRLDFVCACDIESNSAYQKGMEAVKGGATHAAAYAEYAKLPKSENCAARMAVCDDIKLRSAERLMALKRRRGLKQALLAAYRFSKVGYLGQSSPELLYVQEAAVLLGIDEEAAFDAVVDLYAEEKLQLNGAILEPFEKRFRFPSDVAMLIDVLTEYADYDIHPGESPRFERVLNQESDCRDPKEVFGPENWPHADPAQFMTFLRMWGRNFSERAKRNPDGREARALGQLVGMARHFAYLAADFLWEARGDREAFKRIKAADEALHEFEQQLPK